jgi:hypothetical protein
VTAVGTSNQTYPVFDEDDENEKHRERRKIVICN